MLYILNAQKLYLNIFAEGNISSKENIWHRSTQKTFTKKLVENFRETSVYESTVIAPRKDLSRAHYIQTL